MVLAALAVTYSASAWAAAPMRAAWKDTTDGAGLRLLEWSEAQRQVEAASGKVLQSHNESHAFRRYSPTPDAAAFGPPAGVACE